MPLLTLDGIGVRLGGRQVLSDVTFSLEKGDFTGIIGPNGAGKTTLLRVILGLIEPSGGRVLVDGEPLHRKTLHNKNRAAIGYVPQKLVIDQDMPLRARDVVSLGLDGHRLGFGFPSRQRRELVDAALADVGADGYADARVGELSGGEQQRVLVAHALISRPKLLLLDEPLANLDLRSEQEIVTVLGKLAREHEISVLLSAHDMNPLLAVMDRIVYVANGQRRLRPDRRGGHLRGPQQAVRPSRGRGPRARPGTGGCGGGLMHYLFEPGLFSSGPVRTALLVGAVVAITSGVIGVFTVLRGQSFAGHSLADVATTGGAGAFLVGLNQFWGFLAAGVAAAAVMEGIGVQRRRGRDVATGVVLGAALGAAALFLYLGTLRTATTGASFTVLFGSIFVISPDTVPALVASGVVALLVVAMLARVLLLTSVSPDLARARGVNVRLVGIAYLAALAVSVSLAAVAIGAVLSTALLIGPSATALRITKTPARAMAVSALGGLVATWLGIVLAYDSYYWPPHGHGWPVSFFVVALVLIGYLLSYIRPRAKRVPRSPHEGVECSPA